MKLYGIADEQTVRGLRLAGVEARAVASSTEAAAALAQAVARPDAGVVVLTQQVGSWIRAEVDECRSQRDRPLIVEIPGPDGPLPGHRGLRHLAGSAVGIRIKQGD